MVKFVEFFEKFLLLALVFLFPIFFLPFSFEFFEFNKIYLLFYSSLFLLLLKMGRMLLLERKIYLLKNPLNFSAVFFLIVLLFSFALSADKKTSLFGTYGKFFDSALFLFSLLIFLFLVWHADIQRETLLKVFLVSTFLSLVSAYFSFFSVWKKIPFVSHLSFLQANLGNFANPFNFATPSIFTFSVFLLLVISALMGVLMSPSFSKTFKAFCGLFLFLAVLFYFIVDYSFSHLILILSFATFLFFTLKNRTLKENVNFLLLPIFVLLLGIFFFFVTLKIYFLPEVLLPQKISYLTAFNSLLDPKNFFVGSGPASFLFQYLKEKPKEALKTDFWSLRFVDRATNNLSETLICLGFLGAVALLSFFFVVFKKSFSQLSKEDLPYFFPLVVLFFAQFFHYQNSVLGFSLFFFLGLWTLSEQRVSLFEYSFEKFPELNLVLSTLVLLFLIFFGFSIYFGANFYVADVYFAKTQSEQNLDKKFEWLQKVQQKNPYLAQYAIFQSQLALAAALGESQKPQAERSPEKITRYAQIALREAQRATQLAPNSPLAWEAWGVALREIAGFQEETIEAFKKELSQNPKDPFLFVELVKLYFGKNDLETAKKYLEEGKKLKEMGEFYLYEGLIEELKGNDDKAIEIFEKGVKAFPFHVELNFHLGRIYYKKERLDEAIARWEFLANNVFPNHSNSLYFLALAYEKKGNKEKALYYLQRVRDLNPGVEEIQKKIEELKK